MHTMSESNSSKLKQTNRKNWFLLNKSILLWKCLVKTFKMKVNVPVGYISLAHVWILLIICWVLATVMLGKWNTSVTIIVHNKGIFRAPFCTKPQFKRVFQTDIIRKNNILQTFTFCGMAFPRIGCIWLLNSVLFSFVNNVDHGWQKTRLMRSKEQH